MLHPVLMGLSCVCCSAAYLEAASFGGVQNEELFEQVLTVGGHVERNPVFTTQHALSQFLEMDKRHEKTFKIQLQTLHAILFILTSSDPVKGKQPHMNA